MMTAELELYWDAYDRADYKIALRIIRPLAERGEAVYQCNLGSLYTNGAGVRQDCG